MPTIFSDPNGMPLGRTPGSLVVQSGSIKVLPETSLIGSIYLQGRSNHSNTTVTATTGSGGPITTMTGMSGTFAMTAMMKGTYNFVASFPGYLTATRSQILNEGSNTVPLVTLLGGDANRDGKVSIQDLSYIGARFLTAASQADINGDGVVNILDLAMTGANYGQNHTTW